MECQEKWNEVTMTGGGRVEEEWQSGVVNSCIEVCGTGHMGGSRGKGSEWWDDEMRVAVDEKR